MPTASYGEPAPQPSAGSLSDDEQFLAWSVSRHKQLQECERKDFYRRIALRLNADVINRGERSALERLKHLTELPLIGGRIQHEVATDYVIAIRQRKAEPGPVQLVARARAALEQVWHDAEYPDAWRQAPEQVIGLREVIQRGHLRAAEVAKTTERVLHTAATLDQLPLMADLRQCEPHEIRVYSKPVLFDVDDVWPMWAAPDVIYRHRSPATCDNLVDMPTWCIVDFKSGQADPDAERLQLAAYALFIEQRERLAPTDGTYLGRIVRLGTGLETWMLLSREDMDDVRRTLKADRELIQARLAEMPRTGGLHLAAAAFLPSATPRACLRCVYATGCQGARRMPGLSEAQNPTAPASADDRTTRHVTRTGRPGHDR